MTTSNYGYDIAFYFTHNNIMLEHQCDEQQEHRRVHGRAQHAVLSTLRTAH